MYKLEKDNIPDGVRDDAIALLKEFEGCKLTAYQCSAGVWTIGYGHTANVKKGDTISQKEADAMLAADLVGYHNQLIPLVLVPLYESMHAALISFIYNLGSNTCKTSSLFKRLNEGKYELAAECFPMYCNAGGKRLEGLVRRRRAEQKLFLRDMI